MKITQNRRRILLLGLALGVVGTVLIGHGGSTPVADAATARIGTPTPGIKARTAIDGFFNFSLVDTGQPATQAGTLTLIEYYAARTGAIRFFLTDATNVVQWVSPSIPVSSLGFQTYTPTAPMVQVGWRLGYYTQGQGVIPYNTRARIIRPRSRSAPTAADRPAPDRRCPLRASLRARTRSEAS